MSFLHFRRLPSKGVKKKLEIPLINESYSSVCLSRSQSFLFTAYILKLMSLPYCFHSFSMKNWNCRGHIVALGILKLLIADWSRDKYKVHAIQVLILEDENAVADLIFLYFTGDHKLKMIIVIAFGHIFTIVNNWPLVGPLWYIIN